MGDQPANWPNREPIARAKPARRWLSGGLLFAGLLALLSTWFTWNLIRPWVVSIKPGEPLLVAQMPDRQGLVSGTGITAIAFEWESVRPFNHLGLAQVQRGNKHGWINRRGEMVIPCEYDSANDFRDDYWIAQKKGKTGILDQHGNTLIPFDYESIGEFDREGYAPVKRDDRWGFINRAGRLIVPCEWEQTQPYDEYGHAAVRKDRRWGAIDRNGQLVYEHPFVDPLSFDRFGVATVSMQPHSNWILVDRNLQRVMPERQWLHLGEVDKFGMYLAQDLNRRFGWVDCKGNTVIDYRWRSARRFDDQGLAVVWRGKWGVINTDAKLVFPYEYDVITDFDENGLAAVEQNGKWGAVNAQGKLVIACKWDQLGTFERQEHVRLFNFDTKGWAQVQLNNQWGWIDQAGNNVIKCQYSFARPFHENGLAIVQPDHHHHGIINRQGQWVVKPIWNIAWIDEYGFIHLNKAVHPLNEQPILAAIIDQIPQLRNVIGNPLHVIADPLGKIIWRSDTQAARVYLPLLVVVAWTMTLIMLWTSRRRTSAGTN